MVRRSVSNSAISWRTSFRFSSFFFLQLRHSILQEFDFAPVLPAELVQAERTPLVLRDCATQILACHQDGYSLYFEYSIPNQSVCIAMCMCIADTSEFTLSLPQIRQGDFPLGRAPYRETPLSWAPPTAPCMDLWTRCVNSKRTNVHWLFQGAGPHVCS